MSTTRQTCSTSLPPNKWLLVESSEDAVLKSRFSRAVQAVATALLVVSKVSAAGSGVMPSPVAFYSDGLKETFDDIAAIATLVRLCERKFWSECGDVSKESFALNREELKEINKISIVEISQSGYDDSRFDRVSQIGSEISLRRHEFLKNFYKYELLVISRYAATSDVCPVPKQGSGIAAVLACTIHEGHILTPGGSHCRRAQA